MPPKKQKKAELVNFYSKMPKSLLNQTNNPNFDIHHIKIPFRMLIVGSSGSYKTGTLLNLINIMSDTFMTATIITKNADEPLYKFIQTKIPSTHLTIVEGVQNIPKLDEFDKKENHLVVFDDLMLDNLKDVAEYFIRARKQSVSCVFISQSYFSPDKHFKLIRRNCNYIILKKISGMRDLNLIMREYSLNITKEEFVKLYESITNRSLTDFLMIDLDAPPNERFRHNFDAISLNNSV
jgi:hypothetical protein